MSMSRKDYEAIAAAIRRTHEMIDETPAGGEHSDVIDAERHIAVEAATRFLGHVLAENPRFDRTRFTDACEPKPAPPKSVTYRITRFYEDRPNKVIATGFSLDEAQAHCNDESTHGNGWFDGYDEE